MKVEPDSRMKLGEAEIKEKRQYEKLNDND